MSPPPLPQAAAASMEKHPNVAGGYALFSTWSQDPAVIFIALTRLHVSCGISPAMWLGAMTIFQR